MSECNACDAHLELTGTLCPGHRKEDEQHDIYAHPDDADWYFIHQWGEQDYQLDEQL